MLRCRHNLLSNDKLNRFFGELKSKTCYKPQFMNFFSNFESSDMVFKFMTKNFSNKKTIAIILSTVKVISMAA